MSSTKLIKQRIKSTKSTAQITKAMEVVSATKMRKSQGFALRARPYAVASLEVLHNLLSRTPVLPLLLQAREVKHAALLVITSDKGLAGAFNANVIKKAEQWIENKKNAGAPYVLIVVGKKARDYFQRRNIPIAKSFWGYGDFSTLEETGEVARTIIDGFLNGLWDEVDTAYTHFRTTLLQEAVLRKTLPVSESGIKEIVRSILPERGKYADARSKSSSFVETTAGRQEAHTHYVYEYKFEPNPAEILNILVPQLLRMHIHHIILESNASEHSARMVAMKNASESASDIISELTLAYNKSRQAGITRELIEITAGKEALET